MEYRNGAVLRMTPVALTLQRQNKLVMADLLDRKTTQIDAVIGKTNSQIERLQEYRAALIYNAVTGKINVQGYVH